MSGQVRSIGLAFLTLLFGTGCNERTPRSFVQPNVLKKADLDGTWYYVQTVLDAPVTSQVMFIGNSSELMKIKFDVEENFLFARRSYEQIVGSEDAYQQDPRKYQGQPVAAWKIEKQFDIIRDYNPTTGEETNKIIESEERAWNNREFIRVDWSNSELSAIDLRGLAANFFFAGYEIQSASYWESNPEKPDAIHFERADSKDTEFSPGEATYFDVTNKWITNPRTQVVCQEIGSQNQCFHIPSCFLNYQTDDCAAQVVKVRHGFAKISPAHDYEPRHWDGNQMQLFGIWDVGLNRLTYNRQYGITNTGFQRKAARFNLWKKSFQSDIQADGTTKQNPIPYAERELRTIPYYASCSTGTFPPELFSAGAEVIRQWNSAVQVAVKDVSGLVPTQDTFVLCHNPVKMREDDAGAKDQEACRSGLKPDLTASGTLVKDGHGEPIYRVRQGDPRRSNIFWVNQPQSAGPLGYGPPLFDIETGEIISGQANIYGAALDTYAASARDLTLLVAGKLPQDQFAAGANVSDWVTQHQSGVADSGPIFSQADVEARARAMKTGWLKGQSAEVPIDSSSPARARQSFSDRQSALARSGLFQPGQAAVAKTRLSALRGKTLEAMLSSSTLSPAQTGGWQGLSDAEKARVSPLRFSALEQTIEAHRDVMRAQGHDFSDFIDDNLYQHAIALANDPDTQNLSSEALRRKLRSEIFVAVALHEMGHNVGLRHNFRASYDALNYFPEYWRLRKGAAMNPGAQKFIGRNQLQPVGAPFAGKDCGDSGKQGQVRSRYIDCPGGALSVDEVKGRVTAYQYSSVMDYGSTFGSDLVGLGRYDKAAIKFSYAGDGYVEVFTQLRTNDEASLVNIVYLQLFQDALGLPSALNFSNPQLQSVNYYNLPNLFSGGIDGISKRVDVPYLSISPVSSDFPLLVDDANRPMVPYFFCGDEYVGNLTCQRFDQGADAYEQAHDLASRYENWYLLNNFKRDRAQFHTSIGYLNNIYGRYFAPLRQQLTLYVLLRGDLADQKGVEQFFTNNETGWGSFTMAVTEGFDLFGRVLAAPEAGDHRFVPASDPTDVPIGRYKKVQDLNRPPLAGGLRLGLIDGKYSDTAWDQSGCGYYWADECQTRIGYFYDKLLALQALTDSQTYFTGRDTSTDVRRYTIGYVSLFPDQMTEKFGAILASDWASLGPRVDLTDPKAPRVARPSWTLNHAAHDGQNATNIVDPAVGFSLQLLTGIYGLAFLPTTFDSSFIEATKIFVVGNGEAPISDAVLLSADTPGSLATSKPEELISNGGTKEWMVWRDWESGKTYAAHAAKPVKNNDGSIGTYRVDIGSRMLDMAHQLDQAAASCTTDCDARRLAKKKYQANIDVIRSLHQILGYGAYRSDTPFIY